MNFISYSRILIILATLVGALYVPSKAQDSPQDYVNAHNQARAAVGVGPIKWDEKIAAYARSYAEQRKVDCRMVHSSTSYGENLAMSSLNDLSGAGAVKLWLTEKTDYNYNTNTCTSVCGHYIQMVWRTSVRVGCAKVRCNNGGTFITCNYDPRGNLAGQKPY